jgi:hypothetical protein
MQFNKNLILIILYCSMKLFQDSVEDNTIINLQLENFTLK